MTSQREFRILKKFSTQLPISSNKVFLLTQVHTSHGKAANFQALHTYTGHGTNHLSPIQKYMLHISHQKNSQHINNSLR